MRRLSTINKERGKGMQNALQTFELNKTIGNKKIVENMNLVVPEGKIYGLVGKNGAGKTTLMKLICGIMNPTSGSIELFHSTNLSDMRKYIGCMIEEPALYSDLNAKENLMIQGMLTPDFEEKEIDKLISIVELDRDKNKKVRQYSLGMKQRLMIALSLLGNPKLLLLDEPMNGLDPIGIKKVREMLLNINKEWNVTIFISSHIIDELAKMVDIYGIIRDGHLVKEIGSNELEQRGGNAIRLQTLDADIRKVEEMLGKSDISNYKYQNGFFLLQDADEKKLNYFLEKLIKNQVKIIQWNRNEDIEEYLISYLEGHHDSIDKV